MGAISPLDDSGDVMFKYKGVIVWYNDFQQKWLAQIGYEIVTSGASVGAVKANITKLINKGIL